MHKFISLIVTICILAFVITNPMLAADIVLNVIEAIAYFLQSVFSIFDGAGAASAIMALRI